VRFESGVEPRAQRDRFRRGADWFELGSMSEGGA